MLEFKFHIVCFVWIFKFWSHLYSNLNLLANYIHCVTKVLIWALHHFCAQSMLLHNIDALIYSINLCFKSGCEFVYFFIIDCWTSLPWPYGWMPVNTKNLNPQLQYMQALHRVQWSSTILLDFYYNYFLIFKKEE